MKFLGIDYGEKRVGLSFGDELGVASPLPAALEGTRQERLMHIERVILEREVAELVLGHPLNMDGTIGFKAREVEKFAETLKKRFRLPVHLVDERLTSHEAEGRLKSQGKKAHRASGVIDSLAATLILQDFFDQRSPPLEPNPFGAEEDDEED